ncbi:MAG TPA: protein kinase [Gemmatimonadaceae bacterium]
MNDLRSELQRTLGNSYTLGRELTGGGMSTVYVADDNSLGRKVVIKVLPYELAASVSVDRFKREIMLAAAMQHPHIVPVLSAGETDGLPYLIMPFVDGESLRSRLARGPLSVRETVSILKDVSRALAYAHSRGIVHRDIKPDNILLSSGSATVTDFGVAKAIVASREGDRPRRKHRDGISTITTIGTSIGTPAYMAPEQAAGDPAVDHRADLYALGIVGYEMLVGAPPFHGRTPQQLLAAQISETPPPIHTRRHDVPGPLAGLIMQLLEKDPELRPRGAAEMSRLLDAPEMISGAYTSAPKPRSQRSRQVISALAGAGILASVAAGGAYLGLRRPVTAAPAATSLSVVPSGAVASARSVAVLPLVNLSRDTNDAYFAEGMTSDLANALSRIPGLRVAAPSAAAAARDQSPAPADIGKTLNVSLILEGTVQRAGGRLRVTARLVNIADGFTVWSDMFERESKDVFKVQDEISNAIVSAIAPELQARDSAAIAAAMEPARTENSKSYDLYLRGRFYAQRRDGGASSLQRAIGYYRESLQHDSTFARAYVGIANVYDMMNVDAPADSFITAALANVNRAIALEPGLSEAYTSRARIMQAAWRWADAERDYTQAITLDPNDAVARHMYGELLLALGRADAARAQLKRATELDPLSAAILGTYAMALQAAHASDLAISTAARAVELDSMSVRSRVTRAAVLLQASRIPEALRELETASQFEPNAPYVLGYLGYAYGRAGQTARARELLDALRRRANEPGALVAAARVRLGLGDRAGALALLDTAVTRHDAFFAASSLASVTFDPIRYDARFAAIVRRVGLDERLTR